jgi:1-acyl-sn-glycerol-3-phosphate acyltransferase
MLYNLIRVLGWGFLWIMGRLRVVGREHVPMTGGVLLASNHVCYADPPLVGCALQRQAWFMARADLFTIPVLGAIMRNIKAYPVRRGGADRKALKFTLDLLAAGEAVTIFIEGTRTTDGRLQEPELGAAMLAMRAGVPIVPVAIINGDKMMPRTGGLHRTALIVAFGPPLTFPHLAGRHDREALEEVTLAAIRGIGALMCENGAEERVPEIWRPTATV